MAVSTAAEASGLGPKETFRDPCTTAFLRPSEEGGSERAVAAASVGKQGLSLSRVIKRVSNSLGFARNLAH